MSDASDASERARVLALVRAHGREVVSFQALEPSFRYFFAPDGEGVVAYVDTGRAWVTAGAPIAPIERLEELSLAFVEAARHAGRRVAFFGVERSFFERSFFERDHLASLPIGIQPSWSPAGWAEVLRGSRSLREQLRRARAKGVRVRRVEAEELEREGSATRRAMERVIERWLASRKMAPMGFLVAVEPFSFLAERRCFVAEREGSVVALLVAAPIFARGGWFFEDLLRVEEAPNGTNELLVDAAMRSVAEEGASLVTLGLVPLAGELPAWLRAIRDGTRWLYDFEGLHRFKERLRPARWDEVRLAWPRGSWPSGGASLLALHDALAAFTTSAREPRASFLRFGLRTSRRSPRLRALVVVALAALLALAVVAALAVLGSGCAPP